MDDIPALIDTEASVPLTIITGFLGSGKSTFLNYILTEKHGYRIAVVLNEFGDTADIEAKTISLSTRTKADEEEQLQLLELPNGCLCCSIKDMGVAAIEQLMSQQGKFDHILLECSGMADPGPIANIFWNNEEYLSSSNIVLDSIVCVVDGLFAQNQIDDDLVLANEGHIGEWTRQILSSDTILVSKSDIASPDSIASVFEKLADMNPSARIFNIVKGVLSVQHGLDNILGVNAYASMPSFPSIHPHDHNESCTCEDLPRHSNSVTSLSLRLPILSTQMFTKFDEWIRSVLWESIIPNVETKVTVLRSKGLMLVLNSEGSTETWVLQGVRNMYDTFHVNQGEEKEGKIVLIGNFAGILLEEVQQSLDHAVE